MTVEAAAERISILGVPVSIVDMHGAVESLGRWLRAVRSPGAASPYICACDVSNVMRAQSDAQHMRALRHADMILADGTPLAWVSRLRGERRTGRVPGPDFLSAVCERSLREGWSHYFYGGADGIAGRLGEVLTRDYPGINIAGSASPPFRTPTKDEIERDLAHINASGADIVWVGLGCPKQEIWMLEHRARLEGRVLVGVGAAFDFHSGRIERAPPWMRERGLEWLYRLLAEPRRLWHRYLVLAPGFVALSLAEAAAEYGRRLVTQGRASLR